MDIVAPRLVLRTMTGEFLASTVDAHPRDALSACIGLEVAADWLQERDLALLRLTEVLADPGYLPWSVRAVALRDSGEMIGHAGFHTRPAPDYLAPYAADAVEIGYTIYPRHRRQGYAREAVEAMIRWAHQAHEVPRFIASVSPDNIASGALLARTGFQRIASFIDDVDGLEYVMLLDAPAVRRLLNLSAVD